MISCDSKLERDFFPVDEELVGNFHRFHYGCVHRASPMSTPRHLNDLLNRILRGYLSLNRHVLERGFRSTNTVLSPPIPVPPHRGFQRVKLQIEECCVPGEHHVLTEPYSRHEKLKRRRGPIRPSDRHWLIARQAELANSCFLVLLPDKSNIGPRCPKRPARLRHLPQFANHIFNYTTKVHGLLHASYGASR